MIWYATVINPLCFKLTVANVKHRGCANAALGGLHPSDDIYGTGDDP